MSAKACGISFEFFPPKNASSMQNLIETHRILNKEQPDFFSVTYGAGGSERAGTENTVYRLQKISGNIAAHISFSGTSNDEVRHALDAYTQQGVRRIVTIRGDHKTSANNKPRYAVDMVRLARAHSGTQFHISVAAYPEIHPDALSSGDDLRYLKEKLDAGADQSITQFFYQYEAWEVFYDKCQSLGVSKPIIAGIMPVSQRLPEIAKRCGAQVPKEILSNLQRYGNNAKDLLAFNIDYLSGLCQNLLAHGADGLHFYTMNQAQPACAIWQQVQRTLSPTVTQ